MTWPLPVSAEARSSVVVVMRRAEVEKSLEERALRATIDADMVADFFLFAVAYRFVFAIVGGGRSWWFW
jgi:hypothetical protein